MKVSHQRLNIKKPTWLVPIITAVVVVLVLGSIALYSSVNANYAEDVAKPLEEDLVANGAVKKCSRGDNGRGIDNTQPWYRTYLELPTGKEEAIAVVSRVASDNGYNLKHASPSNRGHLDAVADLYIDNWYFDNTKPNSYSELENGSIELAFAVNNQGAEKSCGSNTPIAVDATHSVIAIDIQLPSFKR